MEATDRVILVLQEGIQSDPNVILFFTSRFFFFFSILGKFMSALL
jgi:hypothetical protein